MPLIRNPAAILGVVLSSTALLPAIRGIAQTAPEFPAERPAQIAPTQTQAALARDTGDVCGATYGGPVELKRGGPLFPAYMEDSIQRLKSWVPDLRALKVESAVKSVATPNAAGSLAPDPAESILKETGAVVTAMLPRVPRLVAKEALSQAVLELPYMVEEGSSGASPGAGRRQMSMPTLTTSSHVAQPEELHRIIEGKLLAPGNRTEFIYRIQSESDPRSGAVMAEYRTNSQNEPVDVMNVIPGNPHGVGFGSTWMMFEPNNLIESRFRYLGKQKIDKHETFVLAFAQIPENVVLPALIRVHDLTCRYYTQGVVWIDQSNFEVLRIQTDLLAPLPAIGLQELRSQLKFEEIRIPERNLSLWMPSDVKILWRLSDQAAAELHHYSDYRLFTATSRIVIP